MRVAFPTAYRVRRLIDRDGPDEGTAGHPSARSSTSLRRQITGETGVTRGDESFLLLAAHAV